MWKEGLSSQVVITEMGIQPTESLPPGALNEAWANWSWRNRLQTGVGCCKDRPTLQKWGYISGPTICDCEQEPQTMQHLMECPLLEDSVTHDDHAQNSYRENQHATIISAYGLAQ